MRAVVQRVSEARLEVEGGKTVTMNQGIVVLVGIAHGDDENDASWLARKIAGLRIFENPDGKTGLSLNDTGGDILAVSQFTLLASTRKGNRPSFDPAAPPEHAKPLYDVFVTNLEEHLGRSVFTGEFAALMRISLVNEGPFTLILDSNSKE